MQRLAELRVTEGCATGPARYCPNGLVTRGQMATFLARALKLVPLPEPLGTGRVTRFTTVSVGEYHACAIRMDETVECWGGNYSRQSNTPWGWFTSVSAGRAHTCGIRTDRRIACWGSNDYGQAAPPTGRFAAVSAGWRHSCGLRVNGRVTCWGSDEHRWCALRADRSLECWIPVSQGAKAQHGGHPKQVPDARCQVPGVFRCQVPGVGCQVFSGARGQVFSGARCQVSGARCFQGPGARCQSLMMGSVASYGTDRSPT